eukprot:6114670-Amphidinium_carterae.1
MQLSLDGQVAQVLAEDNVLNHAMAFKASVAKTRAQHCYNWLHLCFVSLAKGMARCSHAAERVVTLKQLRAIRETHTHSHTRNDHTSHQSPVAELEMVHPLSCLFVYCSLGMLQRFCKRTRTWSYPHPNEAPI